jgi:hypothetical protein
VTTKKLLLLGVSHLAVLAAGFALGVYLLPVLTAPRPPSSEVMAQWSGQARYEGVFHRSLKDSDFLHWGEGKVRIGPQAIVFQGKLAPGPDYKLYLSPEFLETEAEFARLKPRMVRVGDVRSFENFVVAVPAVV